MNKIYVFSSTGNSLSVAKEMVKNWGSGEIVSISALMKNENWKITGKNIGFIFPCYYGTIPQIVKEFILKAKSIKGDYFFGFVTSGRSGGLSLNHLKRVLLKKSIILNYGRSVPLASNYMYGWYYKIVMPNISKLKESVKQLKVVAKESAIDILNRKDFIERESIFQYLIPRIISENHYQKDTRPWDKEFSVSSECLLCGLCSDVCPVSNITLSENGQKFNHNCQRCMACIQFCPTNAFYIKNKQMNKVKYKHPEITVKELIKLHKDL